MFAAVSDQTAIAFIELGSIFLGLAIVARGCHRLKISPIPLYLLGGLIFGDGGLATLGESRQFITLAAEIGVLLLLLTLGLEYSAPELIRGLKTGWASGVLDAIGNALPGALFALLLGWGFKEAVLLGGVTWISSSGVAAKVLRDLRRLANRETPSVLAVLVFEDLAMAIFLPVVAVLVADRPIVEGLLTIGGAIVMTIVVMVFALRFGPRVSKRLDTPSDEALLLSVFGLTLFVAGIAQQAQVSAAVGAFLVGIAVSGPVQERATKLVSSLRDLFAAIFFVAFGLTIDLASLSGVVLPALALAVVTGATKIATGAWAARRSGIAVRGQWRAGTTLMARGEFSIVIAGLAAGAALDPDFRPLVACYVLILATAGPLMTRYADRIAEATSPTLRRSVPA